MNWVLTRKDSAARLELPEDLQWQDEFTWRAVAQTAPVYSLGGALIIEQGVKQAGRPITLAGKWAWVTLKDIRTLHDWLSVPELKLSLQSPDGRQFDVIFADAGITSIESVIYSSDEDDDTPYLAPEIHLLTI